MTKFVRFEKGTIELENCFKQIQMPFKLYADFECNLKSANEGFYSKKYQNCIPCGFTYKLVCVDDEFNKPTVVLRGENATHDFIEAILKEFEYCEKVMKKYFNKNLIISEEEEQFQSSNTCWTCEKLIDGRNEKVKIIVTKLENLEVQFIGVVTKISY